MAQAGDGIGGAVWVQGRSARLLRCDVEERLMEKSKIARSNKTDEDILPEHILPAHQERKLERLQRLQAGVLRDGRARNGLP